MEVKPVTLREEGSDPWSPQRFTQNSSVPSQLVMKNMSLLGWSRIYTLSTYCVPDTSIHCLNLHTFVHETGQSPCCR